MRVLSLLLAATSGGNMQLSSPAFTPGSPIPRTYTCEGDGRAPELRWSGVPAGAKSLALVVHDPDAPDPEKPKRDFVHWVVYDVPPATSGLPEGGALPPEARQGATDFGKPGWGGPCPPVGQHRYFFELYALDVVLPDLHQPTRAQLDAAMKGHVIGKAELMGTYRKGAR
jgi:Raf kinase inhibitor-like YbhB/YbcL family protein